MIFETNIENISSQQFETIFANSIYCFSNEFYIYFLFLVCICVCGVRCVCVHVFLWCSVIFVRVYLYVHVSLCVLMICSTLWGCNFVIWVSNLYSVLHQLSLLAVSVHYQLWNSPRLIGGGVCHNSSHVEISVFLLSHNTNFLIISFTSIQNYFSLQNASGSTSLNCLPVASSTNRNLTETLQRGLYYFSPRVLFWISSFIRYFFFWIFLQQNLYIFRGV